jgi:hypothetical protein
MDLIQVAATSGIVLGGYAVTYLRRSGRDEKRFEDLETEVKEKRKSRR